MANQIIPLETFAKRLVETAQRVGKKHGLDDDAIARLAVASASYVGGQPFNGSRG